MRLRGRGRRPIKAAGRGEEALTLWASVQPISHTTNGRRSDGMRRQRYGEGIEETLILLYDGERPLQTGMFIWLETDPEGPPDYRIEHVERWTHQRAFLRKIPAGQKGAWDSATEG